jgi:hypothetical protein
MHLKFISTANRRPKIMLLSQRTYLLICSTSATHFRLAFFVSKSSSAVSSEDTDHDVFIHQPIIATSTHDLLSHYVQPDLNETSQVTITTNSVLTVERELVKRLCDVLPNAYQLLFEQTWKQNSLDNRRHTEACSHRRSSQDTTQPIFPDWQRRRTQASIPRNLERLPKEFFTATKPTDQQPAARPRK